MTDLEKFLSEDLAEKVQVDNFKTMDDKSYFRDSTNPKTDLFVLNIKGVKTYFVFDKNGKLKYTNPVVYYKIPNTSLTRISKGLKGK